ncbi:MliC family protein [Methylocapsa acidiphila]|uniref:MliC family protein n=1 Tax=Methylocapsa acidiphila TaxID=133552 RepID=UPI001FD976CA|nr:MliC family protein [Methylocapsa acidiphila]
MASLSNWTKLAAAIVFGATAGAACATEAQYDCSGGAELTAQFSAPGAPDGHVVLTFSGSSRSLTLPQVLSADGGRYADGGTEFWIKGKSATLTRGGKSETCVTK